MGFAVLGLLAIPKMEPALQTPVPSVGIFTAFGEGLPDSAGVLVPASDLLVVNTLAEKPLESLGGWVSWPSAARPTRTGATTAETLSQVPPILDRGGGGGIVGPAAARRHG
jgi:hypothetical protein